MTAVSVSAHQLQAAISTVTFVNRNNTIEVIHRFYSHDAEHALSSLTGHHVDILQDGEAQQAFGRYVAEHFQLSVQDETELPLSLVGVELEGDFIWVYQETPIPGQLNELSISDSALLDVMPGQVNTVNVECAGKLDTLVFSEKIKTVRVEIDFDTCVTTPAIR
jgi:hypothetical protein